MSKEKICHPLLGRLFDISVPVLSWFFITLPLWLSPFHPALVAYFIISFDLYFFYSCLETVYYSTLSYTLIQKYEHVPFSDFLKKEPHSVKDITHFVIIPNYKEPLYKLRKTLDHIVKNDYPFHKIILVLAFEKRETEAANKAQAIRAEFGTFFEDIIESYHVLEPNEEAGKASNQTAAAIIVSAYAKEKHLDSKRAIITICDADSTLAPNYFSYLTHSFIHDTQNTYHFYWAPVLLYNNFWQSPIFIRIQATLSSILRLAFLSQREDLIQISTYSTSLWLIESVHYWDVDIIPEDWHIFLQAFFMFGDKVKTIPLYTLIGSDAVHTGNIKKTFFSRYEQEKRWAWGVSDIGYALRQASVTPEISFWTKFRKILYLSKNHLLWPVSFFILTISASIPPLINPVFKQTVLGFLLPQISGLILTISSSMIIVYVYIDIKLRKRMNVGTPVLALPLMVVQWYFLPVISFFLSSLPALESHTRIILKKNITYKVTEKV